MPKDVLYGKTLRKSFARYEEIQDMPNLLEIQKKSYKWFLETGLREVFRDTEAVTDYSGNLELSFIDYSMDEKPKYTEEECKARDATYAAPLKVSVRLRNLETEEIKEQEIFMGDFPLMTAGGTFVINGAERVIVSQIVRSPGIYYDSAIDKSGKRTFAATVIPYRGAWLEYETDANDVFYVRIDKNRKLPVTVLVRALGIESPAQIKEYFGDEAKLTATLEKDECEKLAVENHSTIREEALKEIYKKLRPGEPAIVESAEILINNLLFDPKRYDLYPVGRYKYNKKLALGLRIAGHTLARPVASELTGEVLFEEGKYLSRDDAMAIEHACVDTVYLRMEDGSEVKVIGNGDTVAKQVPAAGQTLPKNGLVVLYTDKDAEPQTVIVPDLTGLTVAEANNTAIACGLNIRRVGYTSAANVTAYKQNVDSGSDAQMGTVITVSFRTEINEED